MRVSNEVFLRTRDTREGWPLLMFETELRQIGTQGVRTYERGPPPLPWLVRWPRCAGTRDIFPALTTLVGPVQNIFSTIHYFPSFDPIAPSAWQALVSCRLSPLWTQHASLFSHKFIIR